jgi:hypothetical protein
MRVIEPEVEAEVEALRVIVETKIVPKAGCVSRCFCDMSNIKSY